jgi:hypothetical protein
MVTEMAEHGDLAQVIEHARNSNKRVEEERIWKWTMQMTAALGELHKHYIIHRDIKPANVFLDANDNIKLGDLGIARELEDESTGAETFVGSPSYIAPELLNGVYGRKADIWSLGVTIHQLMTLQPPFTGNNQPHLYRNIGRFAPAKIPVEYGYSQDLVELSQWMLQKDPIYRPAAIDIYAHLTTNRPRRVTGPDKVPFVDAELAVKTFGKDKLEDEKSRVPLDMRHSLGDPPTALPAPRRSESGISEPSLDSNSSTLDYSKSLGDGWLDKINMALTKLKCDSVDDSLLQIAMSGGQGLTLDEMLAMRGMSDREIEQFLAVRDARSDAKPAQFNVEFALAKTFFDSVRPAETAMDMSLVHEVKAGMASGRISTMAELNACLLESKPRFPEAWTWRPTDGKQERELTGMRYDGDPVGEEMENWLLLKHRQELLEWQWDVLNCFFQKLANGELSSAVERDLAIDVARRLSKDKSVNSMKELQELLKLTMTRHEGAFAWRPANVKEQEVLKKVFKHDGDLSDMSMDSTPGAWLSLQIRLELCAFDPINR